MNGHWRKPGATSEGPTNTEQPQNISTAINPGASAKISGCGAYSDDQPGNYPAPSVTSSKEKY